MITLYGNPISGNSHRVQAFLEILGLKYSYRRIDLGSGEHKQPEYLTLNPLGQIPVLTDGELVLRDSFAILVYLARKYDTDNKWLPTRPDEQAMVQQWLSTSAGEISSGPAVLRAMKLFGTSADRDAVEQKTNNLFANLFEPHLARNQWLAGGKPSIADIACYSYIARVTEGDYSLEPYPSIREWLKRIEDMPDFAPMMHAPG